MNKGLYIHIPFCKKKCRYCDFTSFSDKEDAIDLYLDMLNREMEEYKNTNIDTVFIGGGTPSVLGKKQIEKLINNIRKNFNIVKNAEISVEVNPGTLNDDKIDILKSCGVNRISVGVQSFNDMELKALGRIHNGETGVKTIEKLHKSGFDNINIDLMTSIPNQTKESLIENLDTALSLPITHISAYSLILEEGTLLYEDFKQGKYKEVDEDDDRDMYDSLINILEDNGFFRYEISNFARTGYESRHNIKYWQCREYIGIGLSAYSYLFGKRFYNTSDLGEYLKGNFHSDEIITLSKEDKISEFMMMGLRMTKGISEDEFLRRFGMGVKNVYEDTLNKFLDLDLINFEKGRYFLTPKGMDISNSVMCEFILDNKTEDLYIPDNIKDTVDLVLFAGQSNMSGRGNLSEAVLCDRNAGFEYKSISNSNALVPIEEPFGINEDKEGAISDIGSDKITKRSGSMVSALVNEYYALTGRQIVAVSASKGGTSTDEWLENYIFDAKYRFEKAKRFLEDNSINTGRIFVVWCQGESDGDKMHSGELYKANTVKLFEELKSVGAMNCFVIQTGHYNYIDYPNDAYGLSGIEWDKKYGVIRDAQLSLCNENKDFILAASFEGYITDMTDRFHYNQRAYNEVGRTAGENIAKYLNIKF